jgi:hypothetical protein
MRRGRGNHYLEEQYELKYRPGLTDCLELADKYNTTFIVVREYYEHYMPKSKEEFEKILSENVSKFKESNTIIEDVLQEGMKNAEELEKSTVKDDIKTEEKYEDNKGYYSGDTKHDKEHDDREDK